LPNPRQTHRFSRLYQRQRRVWPGVLKESERLRQLKQNEEGVECGKRAKKIPRRRGSVGGKD